MNGQANFETARDTIRRELHSQSPAQFPYGTRGTSVSALASAILALQNFGDFHFTFRIIGTDGIVWNHDGMTAGSSCENEGDFDKLSFKHLLKCKG